MYPFIWVKNIKDSKIISKTRIEIMQALRISYNDYLHFNNCYDCKFYLGFPGFCNFYLDLDSKKEDSIEG